MPFYFLREDGSLKRFSGETTISRAPSDRIVFLKVTDTHPQDIYVEILDQGNVIVKFGPGFRSVSTDKLLLSAESFIVHDQKTNKMCLILWSEKDL